MDTAFAGYEIVSLVGVRLVAVRAFELTSRNAALNHVGALARRRFPFFNGKALQACFAFDEPGQRQGSETSSHLYCAAGMECCRIVSSA